MVQNAMADVFGIPMSLGIVNTSLKFQRRNVLEFMTNAVSAARNHTPAPSILFATSDRKNI